MELKGKSAIITGGARGIGKEIALSLASAGANIVLVDVLPIEEIEVTAREVEAKGVQALAFKADVTNLEQMEHVAEKVNETFGSIGILVNNAGLTRDTLTLKMTEKEWDLVLDVNLKGAFIASKAVIKYMVKQRSGKIVNIASIVGVIGNAGQINYSASKAGMIGLTKSLAKELGSRNINVNAVAPGYIVTAMTHELKEDVKNQMLAQIPLRRFGEVDDVSKAVKFLCSEESSYITGHVLHVTGGMGM